MPDQADSGRWEAAKATDPTGWAVAEALDTQGGRSSTHYRDAAASAPLPDVTVVPRAEPPAEWFREPEGYREAVDGMDGAEMAAHQALEPEAGQ